MRMIRYRQALVLSIFAVTFISVVGGISQFQRENKEKMAVEKVLDKPSKFIIPPPRRQKIDQMVEDKKKDTNSLIFKNQILEPERLVKNKPHIDKSSVKPTLKSTPIHSEQVLSSSEREDLKRKLRLAYGMDYKNSDKYKNIVQRCSKEKQYPGRILFYDSSKYLANPKHVCSGKVDILIAVHSKPDYFKRRQLIRETYGSMKNVEGKKIVLLFFLGISKDARIRQSVDDEIKIHRDIVQKEFNEHYRNMTYKHLSVYDWINQCCNNVKFLLKTDDDTYVNIFQVVTYIEAYDPYALYCSKTSNTNPMRNSGKWKVSMKDYDRKSYPPYCMGYGYILRASFIKDLYWCSVFHNYLWIDDVVIGGLLPERLGIPMSGFLNGHNMASMVPGMASDRIADHMFLLSVYQNVIPKVWKKIWRASLQYSY